MKDIRLEVSPRVYRILLDFIKTSGLKTIGIKSRHEKDKQIIIIYTNHPGYIIGKQGNTIKEIEDKIYKDKFNKNVEIVLEEIDFFIKDDNEPYTDKEFADFMNDYMMAGGF